MSYKITPGGLRLPMVKVPEDVDKLDALSPEEKEFAKKNISMVPGTEGWWMLGNDPTTQAFWQFTERLFTSTLGSTQMTAFNFQMISLNVIVKELNCEYAQGIMGYSGLCCALDQNIDMNLASAKMMLLDHPESDVWSQEERLSINFTNACLKNTMTDELFQEALDTWGETKTVRYMAWVGYGWFMTMMENVLGMKHDPALSWPKGLYTNENVQNAVDMVADTQEKFLAFWSSLSSFDTPET